MIASLIFLKLFSLNKKKIDRKLEGSVVYGFAEMDIKEAKTYKIGASADWWMQWFVDGKMVYSTIPKGNNAWNYSIVDHTFDVDLKPGKHTVAFMVKSGSRGWQLRSAGGELYQKLAPLEKQRLGVLKLRNLEERKRKTQQIFENAGINRHMKLVVYGSSVARGAGAKNSYGWAAMLKDALEKRGGWSVVNKSIGGDNTTKLLGRFKTDLLPEKPDVVVIGLSLANEGLRGSEPESIYKKYRRNMRKLVQLCHKNHIIPVITNCYPNGSYTDAQYSYIKNFNTELSRWNVASIDFLGATDNGFGRWNKGSWKDNGHPNDIGHREMFYSIPLSMFDFLIDQNYKLLASGKGWLHCNSGGKSAVLEYKPEYPPHSFSISFNFLCPILPKQDSVIAGVDNNLLILSRRGKMIYQTKDGKKAVSKKCIKANQSITVGVCHDYLENTTRLYLNGKLEGSIKESLSPSIFYLGGSENKGTCVSQYRNFLLYRSCLRGDQLSELVAEKISHSSLELYSPLTDSALSKKYFLENLAPTQAAFKVKNRKHF